MTPVLRKRTQGDGIEAFHREAGPEDAPILLLPQGHPCSSFDLRGLMAALGDRWRPNSPRPGCT